MFLISNLRIQGLAGDYPVDTSSLPVSSMDKYCIESTLWKILDLFCKMCRTLYNNYNFSPCTALSIKR